MNAVLSAKLVSKDTSYTTEVDSGSIIGCSSGKTRSLKQSTFVRASLRFAISDGQPKSTAAPKKDLHDTPATGEPVYGVMRGQIRPVTDMKGSRVADSNSDQPVQESGRSGGQ